MVKNHFIIQSYFSSEFIKRCILLILIVILPLNMRAEVLDPYDPFEVDSGQEEQQDMSDDNKSAEELILEASILLTDERLLDARSKLLKALQKDPKEYRIHMMLAGYYMEHVGHFRLALRYTRQAIALFEEKNGSPPYSDMRMQAEHAHLLYLLSQARLNLDNYQGSLEVLDEYASYNYYSGWYPGTRAWVLMKLNKLDEAIKTARIGVFSGAEPGRTLNMLGILLSMHGDREDSLKIFREAIQYELSLGTAGQPATPLNNSGEVYKEIFKEDKAEGSWTRAIKMPDGCQHVLPSLNLVLMYIEQLNFVGAKRTISNFESCIAQFPLRNGEEHEALVHLARGRIYLHSGNVNQAIKHLEAALEERQWFGKIGTSPEDLKVGALISLAQALNAKNNLIRLSRSATPVDWFSDSGEIVENRFRSWWLMRRARQILTEDLEDLEDLYIRNTDSMIEYPSFGEVLSELPRKPLENRLSYESQNDQRKEAVVYYKTYLAENYLNSWGKSSEAINLLDQALSSMRPRYDDLLKTHVLRLKANLASKTSLQYADLTNQIFNLNRASLRNYGLALPTNYQEMTPSVLRLFKGGPLMLDNQNRNFYSVKYEYQNEEHILYFVSTSNALGNVRVKGNDLSLVVDKFIDAIFIEEAGRDN